MAKGKSRPARWLLACQQGLDAASGLQQIIDDLSKDAEDTDVMTTLADDVQATWNTLCGQGQDAATTLSDLRSEYEDWLGNLPENLQSSALGEKLQDVVDVDTDTIQGGFDEYAALNTVGDVVGIDLDEVVDQLETADALDLPRGFGKD